MSADFSRVDSAPQLKMDSLSDEKKKQLEQRLRKLGEEYRNRRRKEAAFIKPDPPPRYDDVYFEGLAWLDSLAGPPLSEGEYEVVFSDEAWKSDARKGE